MSSNKYARKSKLVLGLTAPSDTLEVGTHCIINSGFGFGRGLLLSIWPLFWKLYFLHSLSGAKQGLLIRGGDVLERLAGIDHVTLDKVSIQ